MTLSNNIGPPTASLRIFKRNFDTKLKMIPTPDFIISSIAKNVRIYRLKSFTKNIKSLYI